MSQVPEELKFLDTHEWVRNEGDNIFTVGISDHAQSELGDLVFVELAELEAEVTEGDSVCVVESVKAASDIYTPFAGEIVEANEALNDEPELVNNDPYGDGWLYKIKISDAAAFDDLMSADDYQTMIAGEA